MVLTPPVCDLHLPWHHEQLMGKAMMIQHNDSDTSCMRALALIERNIASVAELSHIA